MYFGIWSCSEVVCMYTSSTLTHHIFYTWKNYRQGNYSKLNQYRMITPLLVLLLPCNILIMTVWCSLARNDVSWSGIINKSNIDFYLQGVLKCSQPNLLPWICISIIRYQDIGFGKSFGPKFLIFILEFTSQKCTIHKTFLK